MGLDASPPPPFLIPRVFRWLSLPSNPSCMFHIMNVLVRGAAGTEISTEEWNLLSVAYKNTMAALCSSRNTDLR
ncbi:hypothetical protein M569_12273 [Genlisea aurea]|uniref:Uncharacterized protein n=1 Tax=Genlisea aurea TaxID=192259 RepID=S8DRT9_9LAMI|nr:hypothetical protein M569_12273 [Genlisea aurea]